ncbi:MAG TPA: nucleotide excision repair endonuclease [Acidimicrobiales bacterium]|nr:nucleotide excision repair endonuclease [Acidimicrobiales bacterium]
MTDLVTAAAAAPTSAGVYFFLGEARDLLYIGKAANLRRRLQQHAKEVPSARERRRTAIYAEVRDVRWEILADEESAAAREADLIVALQPPLNASLVDNGRWTYLVVTPVDDTCEFAIIEDPAGTPSTARVYGCFPHLGKGLSSAPGIACSDGLTALLRLLWATGGGGAYPRAISGPSPPFKASVPLATARRPALHRLLAGTGSRLLDDLSSGIQHAEPYLRPALLRDLAAARRFWTHGPVALRKLRLRHGLPPRPISREELEEALREEVRGVLGDFHLAPARVRRRPHL